VLVMIQCHTFNAFTRPDLHASTGYILSQFVGGMAAPLFLFLAGITFGFGMDKLDRKHAPVPQRLFTLFKRSGYILVVAYLFRLTNTCCKWPPREFDSIWKVDILNCMGAAMILLSVLTLVPGKWRVRAACITGLALASVSPIVSGLDLSGLPNHLREYLVPNRVRFPLFPWSAYVAFGISAGLVLCRTPREMLERTLQWGSILGFAMVLGGQYFANLPYSIYDKVDFWTDSPALILIRTGLSLLTLAVGYIWTEHVVLPEAGWVQVFGKTSLLVYWVHVVIVYGFLSETWKGNLTVPQTIAATGLITVSMIALAYGRLWQQAWWKRRVAARTEVTELVA
jgi:hypothetical protein